MTEFVRYKVAPSSLRLRCYAAAQIGLVGITLLSVCRWSAPDLLHISDLIYLIFGSAAYLLLGLARSDSPAQLRLLAFANIAVVGILASRMVSSASIFLLIALTLRLARTLPFTQSIVGTIITAAIGPLSFAIQRHLVIAHEQTIGNVVGFTVGYVIAAIFVHAIVQIDRAYTALGAAHEALRVYASRAEHSAALRERTRIMRDLHDSLGHDLVLLTIQLEGAEKYATIDERRSRDFVRLARAGAGALLEKVRATVTQLASDPLQRQEFEPLINSLCERFSLGSLIAVQREVRCAVGDVEIKTTVYRMIQELLTNVAKHSGASNVRVDVSQQGQRILVAVEDDGCGFRLDAQSSGYGLRSIRERVHDLQGILHVRSIVGAGTRVEASIPLPKHGTR